MTAPFAIVPHRTLYDCLPAALATVMGWSYDRARAVLGPHTYERGTFLLPLASVLLPERIASTYVIAREHPQLGEATANSYWGRMLASSSEIRRQIQGHRAILIMPGRGPEDQRGPNWGHALAWDGQRAIHCGAIGDDAEDTREISLDDVPPWEALILTEITGAAPEPVRVAAETGSADTSLAGIFERHPRAILGFSGGKESVALAHMLEPWRDRVTLAWVNTGFMARHMVDFVRGYGERFDLRELASPRLGDVWAVDGVPADVAPFANVAGTASPRLQPWLQCCFTVRQAPINAYLREQAPCAFINGQRGDDKGGATVAGLRSTLPASVEVALPLADWSEADVLAYVDRHGLQLPVQYAEGYPDSIECVVCPAQVWPKRMDYLARRYPEVLPTVRAAVRTAATEATKTLAHMLATIETVYPAETHAE